jgi:hypothetical protein
MTQQPEGTPIPSVQDLKKLTQQELLDRLGQANYAIQEANRNAERRVNDEKIRSRQDLERLRAANSQHIKDLENQNQVLLRSLSRLQGDLDKLQEEVVTLRVRLSNGNGYRSEEARASAVPEIQLGTSVPIASPTPQLSGDAIPQQQTKTQ